MLDWTMEDVVSKKKAPKIGPFHPLILNERKTDK